MVSALCGEKHYDQDADLSLLSGKTIGIIALVEREEQPGTCPCLNLK